jgi:casein kinase II subunit alpha
MDYVESEKIDYKLQFKKMGAEDIKFYMLNTLKGLDLAHSKGIIHRDIKPYNILFDPIKKSLSIIDWGLAEFYKPGTEYNTKVAALYYKAPEILLEYAKYDYSLDIWSLGCIFASLIFQVDPFFQGKDNDDQLLKIAKVVGTDEIYTFIEKYNIQVHDTVFELLRKYSFVFKALIIGDQRKIGKSSVRLIMSK